MGCIVQGQLQKVSGYSCTVDRHLNVQTQSAATRWATQPGYCRREAEQVQFVTAASLSHDLDQFVNTWASLGQG